MATLRTSTIVVAFLVAAFFIPSGAEAARRRAVRVPMGAYFLDADGDGYGDPRRPSSLGQSGAVPNGADCNDTKASIYQEILGGIDKDADGYIAGSGLGTRCVGEAWLYFGKTYYYSSGVKVFYEWIDARSVLGYNDKNDENPRVHGEALSLPSERGGIAPSRMNFD